MMQNPERHVCRAASLLQKLFFQFREMRYGSNLLGFVHRDGKLFIHADARDKCTFHKFPDSLKMTPQEKEMVLSFLGCTDAMECFSNTLVKFLKGLHL